MVQNNGLSDVLFSHNTGFANAIMLFVDAHQNRIEIEDNVIGSEAGYGLWSSLGQPQGTAAISYHVKEWSYRRNVSIGLNSETHPKGNWYPSSKRDVGFADIDSNDWTLTRASPYRNLGANGVAPGADIAALRSKLANVVVP